MSYLIAHTKNGSYESKEGQDIYAFAENIANSMVDQDRSTINIVDLYLMTDGEETECNAFTKGLLESYVEEIHDQLLREAPANKPSLSGKHLY